MDEYHALMKQAATYREMARFQHEHMRRVLLYVVQDLEAKAKNLKRRLDSQQP